MADFDEDKFAQEEQEDEEEASPTGDDLPTSAEGAATTPSADDAEVTADHSNTNLDDVAEHDDEDEDYHMLDDKDMHQDLLDEDLAEDVGEVAAMTKVTSGSDNKLKEATAAKEKEAMERFEELRKAEKDADASAAAAAAASAAFAATSKANAAANSAAAVATLAGYNVPLAEFENFKMFLKQNSEKSELNVYDHLTNVLLRIFQERPLNAIGKPDFKRCC
jgi:hypothetical protein